MNSTLHFKYKFVQRYTSLYFNCHFKIFAILIANHGKRDKLKYINVE